MPTNAATFVALWLVFMAAGLSFAALFGLPAVRTWANPVQGRRTGLSECAPPFGQTERRAKRTLDRAPP
ncbi:hypothetical protein [Pseudomonas citronellolis]|uniref:hypothetical protein n=1 Tax=Pseudomonas citronellolis TaxID=53408 RepID=UPI0023E42C1A|nr:hypothetical protein [Pseudomonas citronellolis]MDF3934277.1 hypothetical protein [Pseudomonas citronellolis]